MKYLLKKTNDRSLPGCATVIRIICLVLLMVLYGCKKDFDFSKVKNLSWNPDIALALVSDSLTLKDALTQTGTEDHFYIDESGDISILYYYNNHAFRIRPADLIKILPISLSYLHQVTQAEQDILGISDLTITPLDFPFNLAVNNPEIRTDKLLIKNGMIKVNTNHTFNNDGYLTIKILNATKNGTPFSIAIGPFISGQAQTTVDLSGVLLDMSVTPNLLQAEVGGLIKKSGEPVAGDEIRVDFEVSIDTIGRFEGFLGKHTLTQLNDTVRVDVFNNAFTHGVVYFVDPQASITMLTSIGIPSEITIEKLVAINDASGNTMDIADRLGDLAFFSVPSPPIDATKPSIKTMQYTNANTGNAMTDFFNLKPDNVAFQIKTVINPTGTPMNFFSDTSTFYGDLRVKLPLYGHFDHLIMQDTFDLAIEKPEELEHLEFRTNIVNGLPLTAMLQVYFTDEFYNRKDSLTGNDQMLIREAPIDPATHLPYPGVYGQKDTTFIMNSERMMNLVNVKKVLVKAVLHSTEEGLVNVKLRADQLLRLNFSAKAKLRKTIQTSK